MEKRRVVITGMGTVNPVGNSVAGSWAAVKAGKCGIGPITRYDTAEMKVKLAGEVKGLDIDGLLGKREAKKMDRFTQLALIAAQECMSDAGLDREREKPDRCGVIFSSGIGGFETVGEAHRRGSERGYDTVSPFMIPMIISNMAAGHMAIRYGFTGMCSCVVTACAGGTNAVGDAFRHIRDGYAEVMLCGGGEAAVTPLAMGGFTAMKALCESTDPLRASIPFDAERSGFVMGEGAGALLLEELDHAKARGAKIYAEVIGYGANCDAHHITAPAPGGAGGAACMAQAVRLPRHLHSPERRQRDGGHPHHLWGPRPKADSQLYQVHDGPPAGGRRGGGGHLHRAGSEGGLHPGHHRISGPRPGLRSGYRPQ